MEGNTTKKRKTQTEHETASLFYFEKVSPDANDFKCKVCPNVLRTMKPGSGYSNLFSHVSEHHKNYKTETALSGSTTSKGTLFLKIINLFIRALCSMLI